MRKRPLLVFVGCVLWTACTERVPTAPSNPDQNTNPATLTPTACTYEISPITREHGVGQENGSVSVTAPSSCRWSVNSNASWLTFSPNSSAGNGVVTYAVEANAGVRREGRLAIAERSFLVVQAGSDSVRVSSSTVSLSPYDRFATISVTVGSGTSWTATSTASWLTFTAGTTASGSGSGTFTIRADINTEVAQRSAAVTVTGPVNAATITVTQAGRVPQPSQYDGEWSGNGSGTSTASTPARVTVTFRVLDGVVTALRIEHTIDTAPGTTQVRSCSGAANFNSIRFTGGEFLRPLDTGSLYRYGISGRFASADSVAGTVQIVPGAVSEATTPWCLGATISWRGTKR